MALLQRIRHAAELRALSPLTRQVVAHRLTYLSTGKLRRLEEAMERAAKVDGDFLEFGVALGGSGILAAHHAKPARRFLGFDVFGMIPEPISDKDDQKSKSRYQTIRSGESQGIGGDEYYGYMPDLYEGVKLSFERFGLPVDGERIILHKGLFEDSWPSAGVSRIAFAHIDCDWYDPVRFCLEACADKMSSGGLIVLDDYHDYSGARTAVNEFRAKRADFAFEPGRNPFLRKL
jgi:asparagine synthase (glutamine-hydrolysing)